MNLNDIQITQAVPEDAWGVTEVQYKSWLSTYPNEEVGVTVDDVEDRFKDAFTEEKIQKRAERYKNPPEGECVFVAKEKNSIVGFCMVSKKEQNNELGAIYILPEYQGRGIGKKLWNSALVYFDISKDISLEVATYNTQAIEFYKKLGFIDSGKRWSDEKYKMKSGAIISAIEMIRKSSVFN